MTNLFFNPESQLTELEKEIKIPELIAILQQTDESKTITGRRICEQFFISGYPLSQQRLCLWIAFIRNMNLVKPYVLIGGKKGYCLTRNPELIRNQIEGLGSRINAMRAIIDALSAQRQNLIEKARLTTPGS